MQESDMQPDLAQAIEQDHRAVDALVNGDPQPKKRLFSERPDVTLANPLGPATRGRRSIEETLDGVAGRMRDGELHGFELVTAYATPDLAYVHGIERTRARVGGSDELESFALRVTTIWRREAGEWKIALRHADPITRERPIESILER
jgi:ketosteroid isomerase-like protein